MIGFVWQRALRLLMTTNEIVQEMYLRINDYVKDVNKIMYDDKQINTFYVYITLRNIYYSNFYSRQNIKNRKVIYFVIL